MKFVYEYRTRENERRECVISASSREDAFRLLKKEGIRPGKVTLAPGFFNRLQSFGRRGLVIFLLAVALAASVATLFVTGSGNAGFGVGSLSGIINFDDMTRRQVIGDSAVVEKGIRTGWSDVFPEAGERFLASFAVPGRPAAVRATTETEMLAALSRTVAVRAEDGLEARQIKAMVEGLKEELRAFIADGGTVVEYGTELVKRQEAELGFFERAKNELEAAVVEGRSVTELMRLWDRRNAELRRMGIHAIPYPEVKEALDE